MNSLEDKGLDKKQTTELCVMCNVDTNVLKTTNISFREFYVEGAGQLCEDCHSKIYK